MKRGVIFLVGIAGLVMGMYVWSMQKSTIDEEELRSLGVLVLPEPVTIGELDLIAHTGETFDGSIMQGKWTFGFFGYTHCPDICPTTMAIMGTAVNGLRKNNELEVLDSIQGMFISVDAKRDDYEKVRKFVESVAGDFIGVTGDEGRIKELATRSGIGYKKMGSDEVVEDYLIEHRSYIVIYDRAGDLYGYIKPPFKTDHLVRIFRGLAEVG